MEFSENGGNGGNGGLNGILKGNIQRISTSLLEFNWVRTGSHGSCGALIFLLKMGIVNSFVKVPEGKWQHWKLAAKIVSTSQCQELQVPITSTLKCIDCMCEQKGKLAESRNEAHSTIWEESERRIQHLLYACKNATVGGHWVYLMTWTFPKCACEPRKSVISW